MQILFLIFLNCVCMAAIFFIDHACLTNQFASTQPYSQLQSISSISLACSMEWLTFACKNVPVYMLHHANMLVCIHTLLCSRQEQKTCHHQQCIWHNNYLTRCAQQTSIMIISLSMEHAAITQPIANTADWLCIIKSGILNEHNRHVKFLLSIYSHANFVNVWHM